MRLADEVTRLEQGGQVVLWNELTGRSAAIPAEILAGLELWTPALPPPPPLMAVAGRLSGLYLLADGPRPPLTRMIPATSRLVLLLPRVPGLWAPVPTARGPGGHGYALHRLNRHELAIWRCINGARTVTDIAVRTRLDVSDVLAFLADLTRSDAQIVQLRERPVTRRDLSLERLVAPDRPPAPRPGHQRGRWGETTLEQYHEQIDDPNEHFDDRETTVAHAFALPHPALGGQPYGARLYRALGDLGLLPRAGGLTVEIGPGTGELAGAWLAARAEDGLEGSYVRLDRSPELLAAQQARAPGSLGMLGSATRLPWPDGSVDLVLCNEVIADLSAVPWSAEEAPWPGTPPAEVVARLTRYGIPPLSGKALYNLGAWQLVEELARVLAPGGAACLSEFGGPDELPTETEQLDHPEVSICFGHLAAVARALGLEATLMPLPELLEMDLGAVWLSRHSYEALRARLRADGGRLEARAWTPESLHLPWEVEGLHWVPVSDPGPGPLPTRFWALLLRRPAA